MFFKYFNSTVQHLDFKRFDCGTSKKLVEPRLFCWNHKKTVQQVQQNKKR